MPPSARHKRTGVVFLFLMVFAVSCLTFDYISILGDPAKHAPQLDPALPAEVVAVSAATVAVTTQAPTILASTSTPVTSAGVLAERKRTQAPSPAAISHVAETRTRAEAPETSIPLIDTAVASAVLPEAVAEIKPALAATPSAPATPQVPLNADKLLRERFMAAPNARTAKVAVVTLHMWKNAPKWIDCSFAKSKQDYCAQHKYALLDESYFRASLDTALALKPWMLPPSKTPRYRKLQYLELILRARLPFEWLLWVDGDTVFTNPSYTLENRLSNVKSKLGGANAKDPVFVLTRDQNGINNGVWLIRNSLEAHKAIIDIFNQKNDVKRSWADQLSLINFMKSNPQFVKDKMLVLPKAQQPHWQAYDRHPMRPLPWILHLAGHGMDRRRNILKARGFLCGDAR